MTDLVAALMVLAAIAWSWWNGFQTGRTSVEIAHLKADMAVKKAELVVLKEEGKFWDEMLTQLKGERGR